MEKKIRKVFDMLYGKYFPVLDYDLKWYDDLGAYKFKARDKMFKAWKEVFVKDKPMLRQKSYESVVGTQFHIHLTKYIKAINNYLSVNIEL